MKKQTLERQFRIWTILLIVVPSILIMTIYTVGQLSVAKQQYLELISRQAESQGRLINYWLEERGSTVLELSQTEAFRQLDEPQMKRALYLKQQTDKNFDSLSYINKDGLFKMSTLSTGIQAPLAIDKPYFQAGQVGKTYISDVVIGRNSGQVIINFSAPIYDVIGDFQGVILGSVRTTTLEKLCRDNWIGQTGDSYIANRQGLIFTEPRFIDMLNAQGHVKGSAALKLKISEEAAKVIRLGETGTATWTAYLGHKVLGAYQDIPERGWTIINKINEQEVFAPIYKQLTVMASCTILLILLILPIATRINNRIKRPIDWLIYQSKLMKAEQFEQIVSDHSLKQSPYELEILCETFVEMSQKIESVLTLLKANEVNLASKVIEIEKINNELEKANITLDDKVNQRTQELAELNLVLKKSEEQFRTMFDQAPLGIALIDSMTGEIQHVNSRFAEIVGRTVEELVCMDWKKITHVDDVQECHDKMALLHDHQITGFTINKRYLHGNGSTVWVNITIAPLRVAGNDNPRHLCMIEDITERKKAQAEIVFAMKKAEAANYAKSQFLAHMSHEIRTPMNGVFGFLQLIDRTNLTMQQKEFIREAKTASEVLLYIINDILDFSKIEAGKLMIEKINFKLRNTIEDAVLLHVPKTEEKNIEIYTLIKNSVPEEVIGDPARLQQILNNLISNAVKFTNSGEVFITVDCIEEENEMAFLQFEIKDTGIGIRQEDLHTIFQSFHQADDSTTRKYGGTGLGLAISKELVKMMNGSIRVSSIFGKGSIFSFDIRLKIVSRKIERQTVSEKLMDARIWLLGVNENHQRILNEYCREIGCKVRNAQDDGNTMMTIVKNSSEHQQTSIIVIDEQCLDVADYEFIRMLKTTLTSANIKMILFIASEKQWDVTEASERGFAAYLSKPVRREKLFNCLSMVLGVEEEKNHIPAELEGISKKGDSLIKPKILLVEDNEINRKIMITMLDSYDMTCDIAVDGREAVEAVTQKEYDIVFMDCQMPVMDGYKSTMEIRKLEGDRKHTRIIAMTANAMEGDRARCIEAGMDDYISKPIDFEIMRMMITGHAQQGVEKYEDFNLINHHITAFTEASGLHKDDAQKLFKEYVKYLPNLLADIEDGIATYDFQKVERVAHQLKGSSANLRITSMYQLTMKLEEAAIKQEYKICQNYFEEITRIFDELADEFAKEDRADNL